ncbi:OmpA family protein [Marinomonas sp. 15G1-11]|uniref:OmpA family protein n=1 Tax=Marinomonas phaeophyticola TaxID=3004091 RepID=A0ABT4JPS1_9GAMM|nr:OmpA family protein [Marinomonas sp. 15G1-11]MCZ2720383.1 OmpA family protein [Marinomonas sp. 15G1-11]
MFTTRPKKLFVATMAAIAATAGAQQSIAAEGITISPMVGHYNFAGSRDIDDDALLSIALGYQFDSPWATELTLLTVDTENSANTEVDLDQVRLDMLYHLETKGDLTPYLAFGAGYNKYSDVVVDNEEAIINAGFGVKYALNSNLALRGDFRLIDSLDAERIDTATSVGLFYAFGGTKKKIEPAPVVQKVVVDNDADGVNDEIDQCLDSHKADIVDLKGCALDDDKDGVINRLDECLDTEMGAKVDAKGCYIELIETHTARLDVNFAKNSAVVDKQYYGEIEGIAKFLTEYPKTDVVIEGHTDDSGKAEYNQNLSEQRALAISEILVNEFSVSQERVSVVGYGESKPLVENTTEENRIKNRRVVAVVTAQVKTIAK